MAFRLIPREERFYEDFLAMAQHIREGAILLSELFGGERVATDRVEKIKGVEHKCDFLLHELMRRLNQTFVTPIDREDIHALGGALDDVMDAIDEAASLVVTYRIDSVRNGAAELSDIIRRQADELHTGISRLEKRKGVLEQCVQINHLEHEADGIHQKVVGALFDEERDPIMILKWKEIFDMLEAATDRAEDVANQLENIVLKHG